MKKKRLAAHFSILPDFIVSLESNKLPLSQSMSKVESMVNELHKIHGEVGESVKYKIDKVLEKNPGYEAISAI